MRVVPVLLTAVVGVLAVGGCSPGGNASGDTSPSGPPAAWRGSVTLRSGSVPPPYNWSRTAEIAGAQVRVTTHGYTSQDRATAQPVTRTCTVTLEQGPAKQLATRIASLAAMRPAPSSLVGGGEGSVDLTDGRRRVVWTANPVDSTSEYQAVEQAYAAAARCTPVTGAATGGAGSVSGQPGDGSAGQRTS